MSWYTLMTLYVSSLNAISHSIIVFWYLLYTPVLSRDPLCILIICCYILLYDPLAPLLYAMIMLIYGHMPTYSARTVILYCKYHLCLHVWFTINDIYI